MPDLPVRQPPGVTPQELFVIIGDKELQISRLKSVIANAADQIESAQKTIAELKEKLDGKVSKKNGKQKRRVQ